MVPYPVVEGEGLVPDPVVEGEGLVPDPVVEGEGLVLIESLDEAAGDGDEEAVTIIGWREHCLLTIH